VGRKTLTQTINQPALPAVSHADCQVARHGSSKCGLGIDLAGDACVDRFGEEHGEEDVCNT